MHAIAAIRPYPLEGSQLLATKAIEEVIALPIEPPTDPRLSGKTKRPGRPKFQLVPRHEGEQS